MNNSRIMTKALPAALVLAFAGGVSSNANAGAYAIAYNNIFNLAVSSSPFVPLEDFQIFTATSSVGANVNGNIDLGNPPNSDQAGGPVDAIIAYGNGSVFPGAAPTNNSFTAVGQGGQYSYGDAQVSQTSIKQDNFLAPVVIGDSLTSQAWNIAEGYVGNDGVNTADSFGLNGSVTGFNTLLNLQEETQFTFQFQADPYGMVEVGNDVVGGSVNANLDVTFTITSGGPSGATVFDWAPDGGVGGISGGTEILDPFSLNGSIEGTFPGDMAEYDPWRQWRTQWCDRSRLYR